MRKPCGIVLVGLPTSTENSQFPSIEVLMVSVVSHGHFGGCKCLHCLGQCLVGSSLRVVELGWSGLMFGLVVWVTGGGVSLDVPIEEGVP